MRVDGDHGAESILSRHGGQYHRGLPLKTADFNDCATGGSAGSENGEEANFILRKETGYAQRKAGSARNRFVKVVW